MRLKMKPKREVVADAARQLDEMESKFLNSCSFCSTFRFSLSVTSFSLMVYSGVSFGGATGPVLVMHA
jgi:hypothetical protein